MDFDTLRPRSRRMPLTKLAAIFGLMWSLFRRRNDAKEVSELVRSFPVPADQKPTSTHLDGARLFDAVVGEGVNLQEYCACIDSIGFCLAKGVGAPMGSVIVAINASLRGRSGFARRLVVVLAK